LNDTSKLPSDEKSQGYSDALDELAYECMDQDPANRPTLTDLRSRIAQQIQLRAERAQPERLDFGPEQYVVGTRVDPSSQDVLHEVDQ